MLHPYLVEIEVHRVLVGLAGVLFDADTTLVEEFI